MNVLFKILLGELLLAIICHGQEDYDILPPSIRYSPEQVEQIREALFNMVGRTASPQSLGRAAKLNKLQSVMEKFPCNTTGFRSKVRPKSIHRLRPGDIDVVGALGDSLTAGNGAAATNIFEVYTENRGIAWSIGGQGTWREFLTLPNILKEFNPKLIGYSLSDSLTHHRSSQFNPSEAGAMSRDIPYMASILVKRMKNDKRVNFQKDWKLITLMIGSNDFCYDICYTKNLFDTPLSHKNDLIETINYLKTNSPRTLLQIVISPHLSTIVNFKGLPPLCSITKISECPCLQGLPFRHKRNDMYRVMLEWQNVEMELASDPKYTTDDFAVVFQPFTANITFPTVRNSKGDIVTDLTYLSEDCYHFSQKGNARAANALWNNLLEPTGKKSTDWQKEFTRFLCPTKERPYIFTNRNS